LRIENNIRKKKESWIERRQKQGLIILKLILTRADEFLIKSVSKKRNIVYYFDKRIIPHYEF